MKSTQFLNSQPIDGQFSDYMSYQDVADFYKAGHELGWHTQTHADLATLTPVQLDTELTLPSTFIAGLNAVGVPVTLPNFANFATPYGSYNADTWSQNAGTAVSPEAAADPNYVITKIMTKYGSHRSTDVGYNIKATFKASNIVVQNVDATTTPATVQTWITQAKTDNAWLVLVFHEVYNTPDTSSPAKDRTYDVTTANLNAELDEIQTSGISVETVAQALAEIRAQI
jgi:peptidoglycan/xylan/chitin deacetylase (PgdA/CDA1 family)